MWVLVCIFPSSPMHTPCKHLQCTTITGLDEEGIYRVNGNAKVMERLKCSFDKGMPSRAFWVSSVVHSVLVKLWVHVSGGHTMQPARVTMEETNFAWSNCDHHGPWYHRDHHGPWYHCDYHGLWHHCDYHRPQYMYHLGVSHDCYCTSCCYCSWKCRVHQPGHCSSGRSPQTLPGTHIWCTASNVVTSPFYTTVP